MTGKMTGKRRVLSSFLLYISIRREREESLPVIPVIPVIPVKTPTDALLVLEWYAYPVAEGVSTDTRLKKDISIPSDIMVVSGRECLSARNSIRDKIPCIVNLKFSSGGRDFSLAANFIHGAADAYLPKRQILLPQKEPWTPQPGEKDEATVYVVKEGADGPPVCVSPKRDWAFIEGTMSVHGVLRSGCSDSRRCVGTIKSLSTSYLCFHANMNPTCESDNRCSAILTGETIHYNVVDGMGLAKGRNMQAFEEFNFQ
jgi:hypothetical protein